MSRVMPEVTRPTFILASRSQTSHLKTHSVSPIGIPAYLANPGPQPHWLSAFLFQVGGHSNWINNKRGPIRQMIYNVACMSASDTSEGRIQLVSNLRKTVVGTFVASAVFASAVNPAVASAQISSTTTSIPATAATAYAALEPADPEGRPLKPCGPANDGEGVTTEDMHGSQSRWFCHHVDPIFQDPYWEWVEIIHN